MANRAGVTEQRRRVNWVVRIIEIGLVAAIAVCRSAAVHAIRMAERASSGHMGSGQRIAGLGIMIETRGRPSGRRVTDRAGEAEGRRSMDGIGRAGEIVMMAGVAGRGSAAVPLAVTIQTVQAGVSAGQGEIGLAVIESAFVPTARVMAVFAGGGIILGDVIFSPFVIRTMAGIAEC